MDLVNNIRKNWILIIFIGSLIVGWTTFNFRLTALEAQSEEDIITRQDITIIKTDLAVIKNDISYIKEKLR